MTQWLTLSRAVHLTGLSRGALQRKILDGELESFDGQVSTEALSRAFPAAGIEHQLDTAGAFERVARIKDESFGRRVRERVLPSQEVLAQRLFLQNQQLAEQQRQLAQARQLLAALQERLTRWRARGRPGPDHDNLVADLARLLDDGQTLLQPRPTDDVPGAANPFAVMDQMLRAISARVTLMPSGREFLVEGNDTLLEAALKAGLSPNYGCGNGNCGLCKARVRAGQVQRVRHSDYALSAAEQAQGCVLMCSHRALSDVTLEALDASTPADIAEQSLVASVRALVPLDSDTLLLHLQTPRSQRLRFLAGQGVTLGLSGGQNDFSADYPIASCPCDDRNLHFHVRRDPADSLADRLFSGAVKVGEPVNVRGPWGDCVIEQDDERPLFFIAAGHGFAPVKSLIEHAMAAETCEAIHLLWSAAPGAHYLANQVRAWSAALDGFHATLLDAGSGAPAAQTVLAQLAQGPALADGRVFVAGPADFVAALQAGLAARGGVAGVIERSYRLPVAAVPAF